MAEELNKYNFRFIFSLIIIFIIIIALSIGIILYTINISKNNNLNNNNLAEKELIKNEQDVDDIKENNDEEILIQQSQTSYYSPDTRKYNKFIIKNKEDLKAFRLIHTLSPEIKEEFFKDRTVFIIAKEERTGSVQHNFLNASIKNNKIYFNIITNKPEIGTMDMATWYFIASVPNKIAENLDIDEWLNPKEVQKKINIEMSDV